MRLKLIRGDLTVILTVAALALVLLLVQARLPSLPDNEEMVTIKVGREVVREIPLHGRAAPRRVEVDLPGEVQAVIEIAGGAVRVLPMSEEDCPRAICHEDMSPIGSAGERIVCLPNQMIVSIS